MRGMWIDLANSVYPSWNSRSEEQDWLEDPEWLASFLDRWGLSHTQDVGETMALRPALEALRKDLRRWVGRIVETGSLDDANLAHLNRWLAQAPVVPRLVRDKTRFHWDHQVDTAPAVGVLLPIVRSFAQYLVDADCARLRQCENPDCRMIFFDTTRNHSRKWCGSTTCGNLMKVRRFRARHGAGPHQ